LLSAPLAPKLAAFTDTTKPLARLITALVEMVGLVIVAAPAALGHGARRRRGPGPGHAADESSDGSVSPILPRAEECQSSWLMIVLRVLHIGGGVFWAGATFMLVGFVEPSAAALGSDGGRFMQRLAGRSGFVHAMSIAGTLTVVCGAWLMWTVSGGLQPAWMGSGTGAVLSLGALSGLVAAVNGMGVMGVIAGKLGTLGQTVQGQPAGPTAEQVG
jgi:hypothetical protein